MNYSLCIDLLSDENRMCVKAPDVLTLKTSEATVSGSSDVTFISPHLRSITYLSADISYFKYVQISDVLLTSWYFGSIMQCQHK